ncbi:hypothetical protein RMATCC62417_03340 [Rhizopus microsporus]|nr:hypothetical protein RMATCC62417_03340 [Rhizopus microsporus]
MKIWSPLIATLLLLSVTSAQVYEDDNFIIDIVEDDNDSPEIINVKPVIDGPLPCNGYPEYRKLPVNQAFYLGANNAGSHVFSNDCQVKQQNDIPQILKDGARFLDINLCLNDEKRMMICSDHDSAISNTSFRNVLDDIFQFARDNVEQIFIVHLQSRGVHQPLDVKDVDKLLDETCKVHTELTDGTDEYVAFECPFIYKHETGPWATMGELVNYNPDMAQWEGDGELVGVRSRIIFTHSDNVLHAPEYTSPYFTSPFWRTLKADDISKLKDNLKKECRIPAGGIKIDVYSEATCSAETYTPEQIEELLFYKSGCNLNDSPLNTFISVLSVDQYQKHLPYYKELESRMMESNYAKWNGEYQYIRPSHLVSIKPKMVRDEL